MSDHKEPTPIPLRASRKPEPIVLQQPRPLVSPAMRDYIHQEITKALYAIGHYDPEPNIVTMSYDEFEAFMMQVWEDEE